MNLKTGDVIKIFPDTDVDAYVRAIRDEGFYHTLKKDCIVVGKQFKILTEKKYFMSVVKYARVHKGLSRSELAKLCGVTEHTVFNWETGYTLPKNIDKVKEILEIE